MLISMPDPHQPRYTRIGSSFSVKGKERSLDRDGYSEDWDDLEGVPDVVFGITRVPFRSCASDWISFGSLHRRFLISFG